MYREVFGMLVIDSCVRGDQSFTRRYYEAYLRKNGIDEVDLLDLSKMALSPVDASYLLRRDPLRKGKHFEDPIFDMARQFRDAEEILIAAPYWDLSFPALLKIYLEHVSVCDLTFGYDEMGRTVGYCQAARLLYFSSCGGYVGEHHLGFEYIKSFSEMLGIRHCEAYTLEGMDIDPLKRESLLQMAIDRL